MRPGWTPPTRCACNHPLRTASFPVGPDREFVEGDPDYFDEDDPEHCKIVLNRILKVLDRSPGCTNRVIWGFHTMMSAENKVVDLTSDTLALHPDLVAAQDKALKFQQVLDLLTMAFRCLDDEKFPTLRDEIRPWITPVVLTPATNPVG